MPEKYALTGNVPKLDIFALAGLNSRFSLVRNINNSATGREHESAKIDWVSANTWPRTRQAVNDMLSQCSSINTDAFISRLQRPTRRIYFVKRTFLHLETNVSTVSDRTAFLHVAA